MKANYGIIIPAHDSYEDVVRVYYNSLCKFGGDLSGQVVWSNNLSKSKFDRMETLNNSLDSSFCERILSAIEYLQTEYVILQVEDYIYSSILDENDLKNIIQIMQEHSIRYCKLNKLETLHGWKKIKKYNSLFLSKRKTPYALSINCGIFESDYLKELIKDPSWTGWELENYFLKLTDNGVADKCLYSDDDIFHVKHLIVKGKIVPKTYRELKKSNICLDTLNREFMSYGEVLKFDIISYFGDRASGKTRTILKKIASRLGVHTVTEN